MKNFDVAVLGSGASGCICSIIAGENGKTVALIDKNKMPAKKLMATGNGRCNLTNTNENLSNNFNQDISKYLSRFDVQNVHHFFERLGLMLYSDEEGRVYPISNSAKSVVDVLNNKINKLGKISVFNEKIIKNIEKIGEKFKISLDDDEIIADKVVFALGGNNNQMLKKLGVSCKPNSPSLSALKTEKSIKNLANIRISPVKVLAECNGKKYEEVGEVMFKEQALSGIVIFNSSTLFAREGCFKGKVILDLLPNISFDNLESKLMKRRNLDVKVSNFFDGMFVNQIGYYLLEKCKINENRSCKELNEKEIESLAHAIKHLEFKVTAPLENNQVFSGGAILSDLSDNLEAKSCKGLYVCGEACDVDGICGGFNLQWAWTSGFIVGSSV